MAERAKRFLFSPYGTTCIFLMLVLGAGLSVLHFHRGSVLGLTHIGVFTDPPIDVGIGIPCPDPDVPDTPHVRLRNTPNIKTCDSVFIFRELSGSRLHLYLFLYRGAHPPVTIRELCQVRYSGDLFTPPDGTDIDTDYVLRTAPKLPGMMSVEEVSGQEKKEFLDRIGAAQWSELQAQGIRFFDKARAADRYWH
jgi:hypothetical protein